MPQTKHVLVADDEEPTRQELKYLFELFGCQVDEGHNFQSVRELLEQNQYDLIVCDKSMPIGDEARAYERCGLELMADAHLSDRHKDTPFVLNTGDDTDQTKKLVAEMNGIYRYKHSKVSARDFFLPLIDPQRASRRS